MSHDVRKAIFDVGSAALAEALPHAAGRYCCPLCLRAFTVDEIADSGALSLEHAPPNTLGGTVVCLTCRDCNNLAGAHLDSYMGRREKQVGLLAGRDTGEHRIRLTVGASTQQTTVRWEDGRLLFLGIPGHADRPGAAAAMMQTFDDLVDRGPTDASLNLNFVDHWMPHRVRVGWLRSAYLAAFAALGHRYVLQPPLDIVRQQVQQPDADLLPAVAVQIPNGPVYGPGMDGKVIAIVELAADFYTVVVRMGRVRVMLPGPYSAADFYLHLDAFAATRPAGAEANEFPAKFVPWPSRATYLLDRPLGWWPVGRASATSSTAPATRPRDEGRPPG